MGIGRLKMSANPRLYGREASRMQTSAVATVGFGPHPVFEFECPAERLEDLTSLHRLLDGLPDRRRDPFAPGRVECKLLDRGREFPKHITTSRAIVAGDRRLVARGLGLEASR